MMIISNNQGLTQLETGNLMRIDRTSIGKLVDILSDRGWVERRPKSSDRRAYLLYLTDEGQKVVEQLKQSASQANDLYLSCLSDDERKQFTKILMKISKENRHE